MAARAGGFAVYNGLAIVIAWLLAQGAERVAYVDLDAHRDDGVQAAFARDLRVLIVSLHERRGGAANRCSGAVRPGAAGPHEQAASVELPTGTVDGDWLRAFHAVVPTALRRFRPEIPVSQHGCDTHFSDPLAGLSLTVDGQGAAHQAVHLLRHEVATAAGC